MSLCIDFKLVQKELPWNVLWKQICQPCQKNLIHEKLDLLSHETFCYNNFHESALWRPCVLPRSSFVSSESVKFRLKDFITILLDGCCICVKNVLGSEHSLFLVCLVQTILYEGTLYSNFNVFESHFWMCLVPTVPCYGCDYSALDVLSSVFYSGCVWFWLFSILDVLGSDYSLFWMCLFLTTILDVLGSDYSLFWMCCLFSVLDVFSSDCSLFWMCLGLTILCSGCAEGSEYSLFWMCWLFSILGVLVSNYSLFWMCLVPSSGIHYILLPIVFYVQ